jgi:hypothetical protein
MSTNLDASGSVPSVRQPKARSASAATRERSAFHPSRRPTGGAGEVAVALADPRRTVACGASAAPSAAGLSGVVPGLPPEALPDAMPGLLAG